MGWVRGVNDQVVHGNVGQIGRRRSAAIRNVTAHVKPSSSRVDRLENVSRCVTKTGEAGNRYVRGVSGGVRGVGNKLRDGAAGQSRRHARECARAWGNIGRHRYLAVVGSRVNNTASAAAHGKRSDTSKLCSTCTTGAADVPGYGAPRTRLVGGLPDACGAEVEPVGIGRINYEGRDEIDRIGSSDSAGSRLEGIGRAVVHRFIDISEKAGDVHVARRDGVNHRPAAVAAG